MLHLDCKRLREALRISVASAEPPCFSTDSSLSPAPFSNSGFTFSSKTALGRAFVVYQKVQLALRTKKLLSNLYNNDFSMLVAQIQLRRPDDRDEF